MREKYESLALVQLKELAKVRGLKGTSTMKKAELVETMLAEDERLKQLEESKREPKSEPKNEIKNEPKNEPQNEARGENPRRPAPRKPEAAQTQGVRSESSYRAEASSTQRSDSTPRQDAAQAPRPNRTNEVYDEKNYPKELDSGEEASGILEVMPDC